LRFNYHDLDLKATIKRNGGVHNNVVQDFSPANIAHLKVRTTEKKKSTPKGMHYGCQKIPRGPLC
jgi:hypothetical protein